MQQIFDGTSATVFATMVEVLREFGVETRKVMGFGSDGASVMVGKTNGVAAKLLTDNPHSVAIHCCCHRLHLSVSNVCQEMPDIQVGIFYQVNGKMDRSAN